MQKVSRLFKMYQKHTNASRDSSSSLVCFQMFPLFMWLERIIYSRERDSRWTWRWHCSARWCSRVWTPPRKNKNPPDAGLFFSFKTEECSKCDGLTEYWELWEVIDVSSCTKERRKGDFEELCRSFPTTWHKLNQIKSQRGRRIFDNNS